MSAIKKMARFAFSHVLVYTLISQATKMWQASIWHWEKDEDQFWEVQIATIQLSGCTSIIALALALANPTQTNNPWQGNNSPTSPPLQKSSPNHMHGRPVCLIPSFSKDRNIFQGAMLCLFEKMLHRDKEKKRERDVGKGYPVSASIDCSPKQCVSDRRSCSFSKRTENVSSDLKETI